jgi:hypothetical protein
MAFVQNDIENDKIDNIAILLISFIVEGSFRETCIKCIVETWRHAIWHDDVK